MRTKNQNQKASRDYFQELFETALKRTYELVIHLFLAFEFEFAIGRDINIVT